MNHVLQLEAEWGAWMGFPPECVVGCASGTAALHLALEALQMPLGEVITCDFNMVAVPRAIVMAGHKPTFVDCGDDLLMSFSDLRPGPGGAKNRRSRAIVAVHAYGRVVDMARLHELAEPRFLDVVEDLAEAHGVKPHPQTDAACWSLYRNKEVNSHEGGVVAFRDAAHAALARRLRCLGFDDEHTYAHCPRGVNARLADPLAERAVESLRQFHNNRCLRREAEAMYDRHCPRGWRMPPREACWFYDVRVPRLKRPGMLAAVKALRDAGIEARPSFLPMSQQEEFRACPRLGGGNAARASDEVLLLPLAPGTVTAGSARLAFEVIERSVGG